MGSRGVGGVRMVAGETIAAAWREMVEHWLDWRLVGEEQLRGCLVMAACLEPSG